MNFLTTIIIVVHLVYYRNVLHRHATEVAIFLECGALYAVCSLIYIPMFARNIPIQFPFSALLVSPAVSSVLCYVPFDFIHDNIFVRF